MKIEIAEHDRMSESGSSLLRLIQNEEMSLLDLLVREAVQNSLDAYDGKSEFVKVDFSVGTFQSKELNKHFDKIDNALNARFPDKKGPYKYLSVRDANTCGLTGPVRYEDVKGNQFGNLLKLVYEICKPQQNEGAGGSWGLGKTIYFRVGIGLVIYYSRIFKDNKYRSRLAACLVEDENGKDSMIPSTGKSGLKRGIAWWGEKDSITGKGKTIPIENETIITRILSVFGITPYTRDETGTTVIIPYINEKQLLLGVYPENEDKDQRPYWTKKIDEYLKIALQRWYAPRIMNSKYPHGAYLSPTVNGVSVGLKTMLPFFKAIRDLYILGSGKELDDESFLNEVDAQYHVESVDTREVFVPGTSSSGKFAFVKLSASQLLMVAPDNNKSPYQQIWNSVIPMENGNSPIITFVRRPGMIVGYDYNGAWTQHMPKSGDEDYIIGLFVAYSENKMKGIVNPETGESIPLEEYIRQGEKADHSMWYDRTVSGVNPRVIAKIQTGISKKISKEYKEKEQDPVSKTNIGLGHALANILLPSSDFGKTPSSPLPPPPGPGPSKKTTKKSSFSLTSSPIYLENSISMDFSVTMVKNKAILNMVVMTDFKKFDSDLWEKEDEVGKRFPLTIRSFSVGTIKSLNSKSKPDNVAIFVGNEKKEDGNGNIHIHLMDSERYSVPASIMIESDSAFCITGSIVFCSDDPSVKGTFDFKEAE